MYNMAGPISIYFLSNSFGRLPWMLKVWNIIILYLVATILPKLFMDCFLIWIYIDHGQHLEHINFWWHGCRVAGLGETFVFAKKKYKCSLVYLILKWSIMYNLKHLPFTKPKYKSTWALAAFFSDKWTGNQQSNWQGNHVVCRNGFKLTKFRLL